MHPMLTIARRAAEDAGRFLQRAFRDLGKIQIHEKGRGDFVSIADQQAEQIIRTTLAEKYPDHAILGEEYGSMSEQTSEYQWIIDPLDGTANFIHGLPHFSISIGLLKRGTPEIGLVYNPITDDLYTAAKGEGAQLNGQKIRANTQRYANRAIVATGFPFKNLELMPQQIAYVQSVLEDFSDIRRMGGAALDFCLTACGRQDAFFELGLRPWDMAAGILIAQEAGCIVTDFAGEKNMLETGTIICANAYLHPILDKALQRARKIH